MDYGHRYRDQCSQPVRALLRRRRLMGTDQRVLAGDHGFWAGG